MLFYRADDEVVLVVQPPLPQVVGYLVVVVVGLFIATGTQSFAKGNRFSRSTNNKPVMIFVTKLLKATVNEDNSKTEMYG
jgi:urea-proton symporter